MITLEPIPTQNPKPEIIPTLTVPSDINETKLKKELENIFDQSSNNESSNHIVIIRNANDIIFNFELKKKSIHQTWWWSNWSFNQRSRNIKPKTFANWKTTKKYSSKSQINGTVMIVVPDYVNSVSIDSIDMKSQCSLSVNKENKEQVNLTVKKITANKICRQHLQNYKFIKQLN